MGTLRDGTRENAERTTVSVSEILLAARERVRADVVFLTHFEGGEEVFLVGEGDVHSFGPIAEGSRVPLTETYCDQVVRDCLPNIIADANLHPQTKDLEVTHEARIGSYLAVPIRLSDGSLYGTLCCLNHAPDGHLSEDDRGFLELLSRLAAHEIELEQMTGAIVQAQEAVARVLAEWETFDEALTGLLEAIAAAFNWTAAVLWSRDSETGALRARASWATGGAGGLAAAMTEISAPAGGLVEQAWSSGEPPQATLGAPAHPGEAAAADLGARSHVAFPVVSGHEVVAVIECYCSDLQPIDEATKHALVAIGAQIGQTLTREGAEFGGPLLTARELEVLQLAADGASRTETAAKLHVSETTIASHLRNIYRKFGVSDRAAAVAYALRRRMIR